MYTYLPYQIGTVGTLPVPIRYYVYINWYLTSDSTSDLLINFRIVYLCFEMAENIFTFAPNLIGKLKLITSKLYTFSTKFHVLHLN